MIDQDREAFERQLQGYRLATAEILYHMPDHPALLQSYVWQEYDLAPHFPELQRFLDFWERSLDGRLHSVRVANVELVKPSEVQAVTGAFLLH
jgi:uncharacterized protein Usg